MNNLKPHSKLGIVSCAVGLVMFLVMTVLLIANNLADRVTSDPQQIGGVMIATWVTAGFVLIPVHLAGLGLGVVGLFMRGTRKVFAWIGVALNLILGIGSVWPWIYLIWHGLGRA